MRYWLFQNNQVLGPYDREQLVASAGFSAESLICPEGRKGTQMGDWQRAGVVAELAEALLRMTRVPAGTAAGAGSEPGELLPPEPTLKDLAVLGTLQEKVGLLENSMTQLQEELRARDKEIAALKIGLSQKSQEATALHSKLVDLSNQVSAASGLPAELSQARQAQAEQDKTVTALRSRLESLSAEMAGLQSAQTQLRQQFQEKTIPAVLPTQPPPKLESLAIPASSPAPVSAVTLEMPVPLQAPTPSPFPTESPAEPPKPKTADDLSFMELTETAPKKKGGKGLWIMLTICAFSALVGAAAYYLGFFAPPVPTEKKAPPAQPAAMGASSTPNPQQGLPDRTQEAIEFAKSYPIGNSKTTLSAALEGNNPPPGLSPWMVEKLEGDKYRVNFYAPDSKKPRYQFGVDLNAHQIRGLDEASQAVLEAPAALVATQSAAPKHRKRRLHRRAAAQDNLSSSAYLGSTLNTTQSPRPKRKSRKKRAKTLAASGGRSEASPKTPSPSEASGAAAQSDQTVLPPEQPETAQPSAAKKAQEEESLEDLLLPGVPKQHK